MKLVALCGYAGAGKDTAARGLIDLGWTRYGFADRLKLMAHDLGWDGEKDDAGRRFLQDLGMAVRECVHRDAWVWAIADDVINDAPVVITDCRFLNEIEWVRKMGGQIIWIVRPGCGPVNHHVSEHEWTANDPDHIITNDEDEATLQARLVELVGS